MAKNYANQNNVSTHNALVELIAHEEARHTFKLL